MTELGRYLLRRLWVDEPGRQVAEAQTEAGEIVYVHLFSAGAGFAKALFSISRTLQTEVPDGVVRIHDYGLVDGRPFVTVLPGQGVPLSSALLDESTPSEDDAIEVIVQAARALKALYEVSHHGALDPGAIVVYPNGEVRIDGLGRTRLAEHYGLLGKPSIDRLHAYRPENAMSASGRDVAALAAILHDLLAKHPPTKSPSGRFKVSAAIGGRVARILEATFDRPDETTLDDFISRLEGDSRRAGAEDLWDFAALISDWSESSAGRTQMAYPTTAVLSSSFAEDETLETVSFSTSTFDAKTDGDDPLLGQALEGYEILRHIDSGAFADIYLARNKATGQTAAIKVLHEGLAAVESIKRRLEREAQALISIRHPNVARAFQLGHSSAGAPLVVLEYLEGRTLLDVIDEEAPMATERIIELALQIASGLDAIHKAGVVHRDLKPSNIMVTSSPKGDRLKILDFGVSRWMDSDQLTRLTQAKELVGSPGYMAPEQIESASEAGPAADLYALGVTIYLMRNRVPPFSGDRDELLFKHVNAPAPRLMDSDPLCPIVERLLAKTPEQRFASASAVTAALSQLRDETTRKAAPRPTRSPAKKPDRLPVYAAILVAALAGLGFAIGWLSRAQHGVEPPLPTMQVEVKAIAGAPKAVEMPDPPELSENRSQVEEVRPSPRTRGRSRRKKAPEAPAVEEQAAVPQTVEIPQIDEISIDAKLSRILKKLRENVSANREGVAELERRYFSLRAMLEAGPKGARALRLLDQRATKLEADLDQLSP